MTTSSSRARTRLAMAVAFTTAAASTQAAPPQFNDARAFGMGGTGVAAARPSGAALFNPSLLAADHSGWNDGFAVTLPSVTARYAENEDVVDEVDRIQDTIEDLETTLNSLNSLNTNTATQSDIDAVQNQAGELASQLRGIDNEFVRGDVGLGTLFALPSPTLGVSLHANAQLRATVESRIDPQDLEALDEVANLSNPQNADDIENALDQLYDSGEIKPESDGRVLASAVGEIGLTLARSFEIQGQSVNFGVTPKLVQMRTFDYAQGVDNFDEDDFDASDYETEDTHVNVDLGASADFGGSDQWRVGASVRNLIPQTLKTVENNGRPLIYEQEEMKLDPLVTVGVAHTSSWHTLTADLDLTKNEGIGPAADQQWLAVGGEFNVYDWINLRAGARQNLASETGSNGIEEETQYTAGFALSPWALRIEAGALFSSEEVGGAVELGMSF